MNVTSLPGTSSFNLDLFQIQKYAAYFFISYKKKDMSSVTNYTIFLSPSSRSVYHLEVKPTWGTMS